MEAYWEATLFDDESVREKVKVMEKYDAMLDDTRNPIPHDIAGEIEKFLEFGKKYRFTFKVEEV